MVITSMIQDTTILVTGGTRSTGKHLIKQCLRRGAKQVIATGTSKELIEAAKRDIIASNSNNHNDYNNEDRDRVQWVVCDLTKQSDRAKLVADLSNVPLDGIIHNAASSVPVATGKNKERTTTTRRARSPTRSQSPQRRRRGPRSVSPVAFLAAVPLHGVTIDADPNLTKWQQSSSPRTSSPPRTRQHQRQCDNDHDYFNGMPTPSQREAVRQLELEMTLNFRAPVELTKGLLDGLAKRPGGAFVCFVTRRGGNEQQDPPSKAVLHSYANSLRADLGGSAPSIKVMVRETATTSNDHYRYRDSTNKSDNTSSSHSGSDNPYDC